MSINSSWTACGRSKTASSARATKDARSVAAVRPKEPNSNSGIKFFYQHVLKRDWHTLSFIRAQTEHRLPAVLSTQEVRCLLKAATPLHNQVYFTTVYSLGLRLHQALYLRLADIDGQRLQVHVHRGKGAKDRYVPLPQETLALLRTYWKTHRNKTWLFPATGRNQKQMATATEPMSRNSCPGRLPQGQTTRGNYQNRRRHPYPPPFLRHRSARSRRLRLIQRYLGHSRLETTLVYLHLTQKGHEDAYARINSLMQGLAP